MLDRLGAHAHDWHAAVASTDGASPFVDLWWVERVNPPASRFVVVFDGERLVGGLALAAETWWGIDRFWMLGEGIAAPDHCDVVAAPADQAMVEAVLRAWFAAQHYVIDAVGVPAGSALARVLGPSATEMAWSSAPYLPLDPAVPPRPVSSRVKNTITRTRNRLVRDEGFETRVVSRDPADIERALDDLLRLHRIRWPDGSKFARTYDRLRPVLAAGAADGIVRIHEGVATAGVVASMVVFDHGERRSYYQSGREMDHRWRGVGTVLMADVVADAHASGHTEFDFLRGREPYKLDWTDQERPLMAVTAGGGRRGRALALALVSARRAKPLARNAMTTVDRLAGSIRRRRDPVR